jgi:F-type H+-transporting ATPase subunit b
MKAYFNRVTIKTFILASLAAAVITAVPHRLHGQSGAAKQVESRPSEASTPEANSSQVNEEEYDENKKYKESPSVRKMGAMVGMSPEQSAMAFEVTNFVILVVLLGIVVVKALPKVFRDRNAAIQKDLVDARTATEQASIRLSGVEARLSKLDDEIAALRAQAEKASALDEQRIAASTEEEKQKILAAAEQEIAAATTHARRQLQQYAAELAIEQAARKLVISAETGRLLIKNFADRLGDGSKEGQN